MCVGYHNNANAASSWDDEGWFHSGDLATLDDRGYFRIVGRSKDVIIRGGATVSPREIEEILIRDPRIREVTIIGLPDQFYGEIICACIIPKSGEKLTTPDIQEYLNTQIATRDGILYGAIFVFRYSCNSGVVGFSPVFGIIQAQMISP